MEAIWGRCWLDFTLGWAALQAQMWIAFIDLGWTVLSIRFLQGPSQARSWTLESETLENSGGIQL